MRELFFFRHYLTELQNPDIAAIFRRYGAKGYGVYWYLLERLYASKINALPIGDKLVSDLSKSTKVRKRKLKAMLSDMEALGLIYADRNFIKSRRVEIEVREVLASKTRNRAKNPS